MESFDSFGDWHVLKSIGEGGFGYVHMWRNKKTGEEIATKSLKPNPTLRDDQIQILKKRWTQECKWMQNLNIPYIVGAIKLSDSDFMRYLQDHNYWKSLPVIVMEYCNGGDLRSRLEEIEHVNGLHEKEIRDILHALRYAVEFLHRECRIEHRDIKPENIVIHHSDNQKKYKLTDFGYAREIPENTIQQSVVGTRHYVAPEVIEPGLYTKTVDYWSVGVMTFELICGIRPFIPHREFSVILRNILVKPKKCIAITESIDDAQKEDRFIFRENIFPENICSPIFIQKMEKWLRLALDGDYKTRGTDDGNFNLYSDLDNILETKIVTVFSLTSYQFHYYDISVFNHIGDFFQKLSSDFKIHQTHIILTLPTSHPKKTLTNIKTPQEFFVPEWSDTSNPDNPAAMLYVADSTMKQCDCNANRQFMYKNVSETIQKYLKLDQKSYDKVPIWQLEQLERHVHHLLANGQRHLECYVHGLYEYIISIEDHSFKYEETINKAYEDCIYLTGRVRQFECTVRQYANMQREHQAQNLQAWVDKAQNFVKHCDVLKQSVVSTITKRYKSLLRHCKEIASKPIYKALPNEDIYNVIYFRRFLEETHMTNSRNTTNAQRMAACMWVFDEWSKKMSKFPPENLVNTHIEITGQLDIYLKIQENVKKIYKYMQEFSENLEMETANLLATISQTDQLPIKMNSLCIDGTSEAVSLFTSQSKVLVNGDCYQNGDGNKSANQLIEEANHLLHSFESAWIMDEDNLMCEDSLPTTIDDI